MQEKKNFFFFFLTYLQASLVAQTVENLPAVRETQAPFLGQEDPLEIGSEVVLPWLGETVVESTGPKKCSRFMYSNLVLGAQVQTPPPPGPSTTWRGGRRQELPGGGCSRAITCSSGGRRTRQAHTHCEPSSLQMRAAFSHQVSLLKTQLQR